MVRKERLSNVPFFVDDVTGFVLATAAAVLLLVVPGFALARGLQLDDDGVPPAPGLVLGLVLMPAVDALVVRWIGVGAAIALHLALAVAGARAAWVALRAARPAFLAAAAAWWLIVAYGNVDVDWAGHLHQPLTVLDMVKHAAVVREIALDGLPLHDPFFARASPAGYYHYFYIGPALVTRLLGGLVDARAAFMAGSFVAGIGFVAMLAMVAARARLIANTRFVPVLAALCFVSSFAFIPALVATIGGGATMPQVEWWGEIVSWTTSSMLWVPHHLSAIIAVFVAALLADRPRQGEGAARFAVAAALALAGAFGMSTWVMLAATPMLVLWWIGERGREDTARWWILPLAGAVALVVALPHFADLLAGREPGMRALGVHLRNFGTGPDLSWHVRLLLLPIGYLIDFGVFAIAPAAWLAAGGWRHARETALGRLMVVAVATALVLVSTVRSTIINNDFGYRTIFLAQVPALLWTAALVSRGAGSANTRRIVVASTALGLVSTAWNLVGLRFIRPPAFDTRFPFINEAPQVDHDLRLAYAALARVAPHRAVVQQNPALRARVFDFGLYGSNPVAVADGEAQLFGAHPAKVAARVARIAPLFAGPLPDRDARARAEGIDYLVFTALDPVWPSVGPCRWGTPRVCVVSTAEAAR